MTAIAYYVPERSPVILDVLDVGGRKIKRLVEGVRNEGYFTVYWNGLHDGGRPAASGIYLYRLKSCGRSVSRTMALMR